MDPKNKTRALVAGGLATLALVGGGASIASGATSGGTSGAPSTTATPAAEPQAPAADRDRDGRPCPRDGSGSGGASQQSAPSAASPAT